MVQEISIPGGVNYKIVMATINNTIRNCPIFISISGLKVHRGKNLIYIIHISKYASCFKTNMFGFDKQ